MEIDKETLELIREHPDEPLVIKEGEIVQEDILEAYTKFIEKGLVPEFYTLDKDGNPSPLLDTPLSKEDFGRS